VFGKLLRRGDNTKVARDSEDPNDYSAMIFINEFWRKNYYGELYLYVNNVYTVSSYVNIDTQNEFRESDCLCYRPR